MFTIDKVTERLIRESVKRGEHIDGRDLMAYRPIRVQRGFSPVAEGSAYVEFGERRSTKVLAGIKAEIETPYESSPDEGFVNVSVERMPFASPFKLRELDDEDIVISRVVDRAIRSSEAVPLEKLAIDPGERVRGIYIEIDVMDDFGNVMDASGLAALAALMDAEIPRIIREEGGIVLDDSDTRRIPLERKPVLVSFYRIDGFRLVDPTFEEERVADVRLTFGVTERGEICAVQKSGPGLFTLGEFEELLDEAIKFSNELRRYVI